MRSYLVLLRVEFTLPHTVASGAVRSYRTLSPLPVTLTNQSYLGGLLSAALVVGLRRPGVTWHPALWSPDFPPLTKVRIPSKRRLSGQLRGAILRRIDRQYNANSVIIFAFLQAILAAWTIILVSAVELVDRAIATSWAWRFKGELLSFSGR